MPQRRFPRPWRFEPIPGGYRVIDANGVALAHVYGQSTADIALSDQRLNDDEAGKISAFESQAAHRAQAEEGFATEETEWRNGKTMIGTNPTYPSRAKSGSFSRSSWGG
jgi:hypothetical protein